MIEGRHLGTAKFTYRYKDARLVHTEIRSSNDTELLDTTCEPSTSMKQKPIFPA